MGNRKNSLNKEEICDDCCFHCKDGGSLRICDYKDCLKAYHPNCVGKDNSFLESDVPWTCKWHYCFNCSKTPKFRCFCCPNSICGPCLRDFKFAVISKEEGFCNHCLTLVGLIEELKVPDSDEENIDFDEPETYESFFKHYWLTVKEKEGLTSRHVHHAIQVLNSGANPNNIFNVSKSEDSTEVEDEDEFESSDDHLDSRKRQKQLNIRKRIKENRSSSKRRGNSKEKEFSGWASNLLINFLVSIGKDTTKELSQLDVNAIVIQYCNDNKLFDPVKKKKVVCDSRLTSLLGRKSVNKNSIYSLIAPQFKGNLEQSEDENIQSENENEHESEGKNRKVLITYKRRRRSISEIKLQENEAIDLGMQQQGCFASMVSLNIKLVYLNRSLVEELLQKPETFDDKVIGSFVRIKSDPYDYMQKNSHMLVKVTGVKRIEGYGEMTKDVCLQVSNMSKDISISQLSNDNFSEEECEDLRRRINDGLLEKTSMVEFKEKTQHLHEIITKQWIKKELYRLQKLIDQANEKGWRRELYVYIERKNLLETPSEQQRLLDELPEVIADKIEAAHTDQQYSRKDQEKTRLPEPKWKAFSKPSAEDLEGNGIFSRQQDVADITEPEQQQHQRPDEVDHMDAEAEVDKVGSSPAQPVSGQERKRSQSIEIKVEEEGETKEDEVEPLTTIGLIKEARPALLSSEDLAAIERGHPHRIWPKLYGEDVRLDEPGIMHNLTQFIQLPAERKYYAEVKRDEVAGRLKEYSVRMLSDAAYIDKLTANMEDELKKLKQEKEAACIENNALQRELASAKHELEKINEFCTQKLAESARAMDSLDKALKDQVAKAEAKERRHFETLAARTQTIDQLEKSLAKQKEEFAQLSKQLEEEKAARQWLGCKYKALKHYFNR